MNHPRVTIAASDLFTCWIEGLDGSVRWVERVPKPNKIFDVGLSELFKNGYTSRALYAFPVAATPTFANGDTMASHAGWTELTAYTEAVRQTWTCGTVVVGAGDNTASPIIFTGNANQTAGGLVFATSSTKSEGASIAILGLAFSINQGWLNGEKFYAVMAANLINPP